MRASNNFTRLARSLSRPRTGIRNPYSPATLSESVDSLSSSKFLSPGRASGLAPESSSKSSAAPKGIVFGAPSSSGTASTNSGVNWGALIQKTVSGGISQAMGGGLLDAIGGFGGLMSSIAGLFGGGKKSLPTLTRFELSTSQSQSIFVSSAPGTNSAIPSGMTSTGSVYASSTTTSNGTISSQQIVQTVKQALLTSSSLNDVISEI